MKKDIEQLMQETFRQESATPPAGAWDRIRQRLAADSPRPGRQAVRPTAASGAGTVMQHPSHNGGVGRVFLLAGALAMAAALVLLLVAKPQRPAVAPAVAERAAPASPRAVPERVPAAQAEEETVPATAAPRAKAVPPAPPAVVSAVPSASPAAAAAVPASKSTVSVSRHAQPVGADVSVAAVPAGHAKESAAPATRNVTAPAASAEKETAADEGREVSASAPQQEETPLTIPNIVTPNGDGINDYWVIHGLEHCSDVQVEIVSARGQRVFFSNHYHGEFSGSDLPSGNYFFHLVVKSAKVNRKGVLVVRR